MKIGELAARASCQVETVRYYERQGLLPPPLRDQTNNYRHYDVQHLEQLIFIRRCRALEMTQDEIRQLLAARAQPEAECGSINQLIDAHLSHVHRRMTELQALEQQLRQLRDQCKTDQAIRHCGILRELKRNSDATLLAIPAGPVELRLHQPDSGDAS